MLGSGGLVFSLIFEIGVLGLLIFRCGVIWGFVQPRFCSSLSVFCLVFFVIFIITFILLFRLDRGTVLLGGGLGVIIDCG